LPLSTETFRPGLCLSDNWPIFSLSSRSSFWNFSAVTEKKIGIFPSPATPDCREPFTNGLMQNLACDGLIFVYE